MESLKVSLLPVFLLCSCAVGALQATNCSWSMKWATFGGDALTLRCSGTRQTWWERNTAAHESLADCQTLQGSEWGPASSCPAGQECSARVNSTTASLEYCCTSGSNPAAVSAAERDCYTLSGHYIGRCSAS